MKKLVIIFGLLALGSQLSAQLKVHPDGRVGIGTNLTSGEFKCRVKGNLLLTSLTTRGDDPGFGGNVEMTFKVEDNPIPVPAPSYGRIGVNNGSLHFHHDQYSGNKGYNTIHYFKSYEVSDCNIKENITPITNSIQMIKLLKGYSYYFKPNEDPEDGGDEGKNPKLSYGYLAQEVEEILPDIVTEGIGIKMLDYHSIMPFISEAVKEQQLMIENQQVRIEMQQILISRLQDQNELLQEKIHNQQMQIDRLFALLGTITPPSGIIETGNNTLSTPEYLLQNGKLFENTPNPFSEKTEIWFEIPENSNSAKFIITDLNGAELKSFNITQKGLGSVVINGNELKAGLYLYTLVIDNKIVDTKRMILTL